MLHIAQQLEHRLARAYLASDRLEEFGLAREGSPTVPVYSQKVRGILGLQPPDHGLAPFLKGAQFVFILIATIKHREQIVFEQICRRQAHAAR